MTYEEQKQLELKWAKEDGFEAGHLEGVVKEKGETAKRMKELNIPVEIISKSTQLSIGEIEKL